jgi:20S proteasome subunit alpha 6
VFETCPDANFYEYYAVAIGARCQAAKTYLEKNFEGFPGESLE